MRRGLNRYVPCLLLLSCADWGAEEKTKQAGSEISQNLGGEVDPNDTPATATPIPATGVTRAVIFPAGDVDYYAIPLTAGDRLDAATMTSFGNTTDSLLTLYAPNGTTVIESDDDNGIFGDSASALAGVAITQTGTHYLRVEHTSNLSQLRPYDLHTSVRSGAVTSEAEPNDTFANGQTLPATGGWVAGELATASDVDVYKITLAAGDTIYASLDTNPERDAFELAGRISIGTSAALLGQEDPGGAGADAEAFFYTAKAAGTYQIVVAGTNDETYRLNVTVHPATPRGVNCQTFTASPSSAIGPGTGTTSSTVNVPTDFIVADVDVALQLTHTNPNDLDVSLVAPEGNEVALFTDLGSSTFPNVNITVDEQAGFQLGEFQRLEGYMATPPTEYKLHWFDGQHAQGTWRLNVRDDTAGAAGTLQSWSLTLCAAPAAPTCSGGTPLSNVLSANFEGSANGFTSNGTGNQWARGTPSAAPFTTCAGGTGCFKTNLTGTYGASSNQNLVSPPINLTSQSAPIRLSWAMKYQLERADFDHASVTVREVGGANPRKVFEFLDQTMQADVGGPVVTLQETAGWGTYTADVSAYAGKTIEVVFHLDSDSSFQLGGLAIDDVTVSACAQAACGNGVPEAGEACDDGNGTNGDGCDTNCTVSACGNNVVAPNEVCDDGNLISGDGCDANCRPTGCRNGIVTTGEGCDDGNSVNGDGCDNNCTPTGCGNNVVTAPEVCDDGNLTSGDGCDSNCTVTACGNGITAGSEGCDDGNQINGDGCDNNCIPSGCGNGVMTGGELCDDGNQINGDGCDNNCTPTGCGNNVTTVNEECDDGNATEGDGCDSNCTVSGCGNFIQAPNEECDDGNDTNGDGCSDTCQIEGGGGGGGAGGNGSGGNGGAGTGGAGGAGGEPQGGGGASEGGTSEGGASQGGGGSGQGGNGNGGTPSTGGSPNEGGGGKNAGGGTIIDEDDGNPDDGGCGCEVPGDDRRGSAIVGLLAIGLAALRRRRRALT